MGADLKFMDSVRPIVEANGLQVWDVEHCGASLRILVDRPGGVDLEALAALSSAISAYLDEHEDLVPSGHYELDVSSPGIERRLRMPWHFGSCIGQEVAVKTAVAISDRRRFQGTLLTASDEEIEIAVIGDDGTEERMAIALRSVERAHIVFRWGPPPKTPRSKMAKSKAAHQGRKSSVAIAAPTQASVGTGAGLVDPPEESE